MNSISLKGSRWSKGISRQSMRRKLPPETLTNCKELPCEQEREEQAGSIKKSPRDPFIELITVRFLCFIFHFRHAISPVPVLSTFRGQLGSPGACGQPRSPFTDQVLSQRPKTETTTSERMTGKSFTAEINLLLL